MALKYSKHKVVGDFKFIEIKEVDDVTGVIHRKVLNPLSAKTGQHADVKADMTALYTTELKASFTEAQANE